MTHDRDEALTRILAAPRSRRWRIATASAPRPCSCLLRALERGGGDQAQFSHPDLGGMGQWSRHGMIMVGDMFNDALKARVDALCRDTAALLERPGLMHEARRGKGFAGAGGWWPAGCGRPSATGGQNDMRYACFPETQRLAIGRGESVELYDTGEHRIHGVSQQQGHGQDLRFTSQLGTVALHDLERIGAEAEPREVPREASAPRVELVRDAPISHPQPSSGADVLDMLERLHALQRKGVLSEAEFSEKKKELLGRL